MNMILWHNVRSSCIDYYCWFQQMMLFRTTYINTFKIWKVTSATAKSSQYMNLWHYVRYHCRPLLHNSPFTGSRELNYVNRGSSKGWWYRLCECLKSLWFMKMECCGELIHCTVNILHQCQWVVLPFEDRGMHSTLHSVWEQNYIRHALFQS